MSFQNVRPRAAAWWTYRLRVLALALMPLFVACTAIYEPRPFWGANGYSSRDIDATTVQVSYLTGAGAHHADRARDYVMYRSAQITIERGFDGFLVLKGRAGGSTYGYGAVTSATMTMRMFKGAPPEQGSWPVGTAGAFDARLVQARLEGRIQR